MRRNLLPVFVFFLALGGLALLANQDAPAPVGQQTVALGAGGPVEFLPPELPLLPELRPTVIETGPAGPALDQILDLQIKRNQTFYEAMAAAGVEHTDIMALVRQLRGFRDLRKVRAGEQFTLEVSYEGVLIVFGFDLDLESWVRYERGEDGTFVQIMGSYPVERRLVGVHGEIQTSLYEALQQMGAPLNLAAKMSDVLGWDLDFSRDARRGDTFRIVYEEIYKEDELVRTGAILACQYDGRRHHAAYRFELQDGTLGYFDAEGRNLQKQLMRAPLNYSRISSGFSYNRRHPVLGRNMPHLGVDYAAPIGTPVWAAGDGTVIDMGNDRANGRYVRIRHTNREYETYYLHFSRFARGLQVGKRVRQGEVIGYVGATGYATGPHLDFRVKRSGRFINPRTMQLPAAEPVPAAELAGFAALRERYDLALAELHPALAAPVRVVSLEPTPPWQDPWRQAAIVPPFNEPLFELAAPTVD